MAAMLFALATDAPSVGGNAAYERMLSDAQSARVGDDAICRGGPGERPFAGNVADPRTSPDGADATPSGSEKGGAHLKRVTPFAACFKMARRDMAALWDYVQTVEPTSRPVASNRLRLPFNQPLTLPGAFNIPVQE
jgi:hypothetical protein